MRTTTPKRSRASLDEVFEHLRARAADRFPTLGKIRLARCVLADAEHAKSHRQYMHWNHRPNAICYAGATSLLELPWQVGLLAHELGHAMATNSGLAHTEEDANRFGSLLTDTEVSFVGPEKLERATPPRWLVEALRR